MTTPEREPKRDLLVQWRIFAGIAVFMALIGSLYWFTAYEEAGTAMLALSSGLALVVGVYLWRQDRPASPTAPAHDEADEYLPAASIWPFGIGLSAFLTVNGLILGLGYAVPGIVLMTMSLAGFIRQSRARA
jgi:Na+/proline symporter